MTEEDNDKYCPVHDIKCSEIQEIKLEAKKKLPIWVFTFFATTLLSVMWWHNAEMSKTNRVVAQSLEKHLIESTAMFKENAKVISKATHVLGEVSFNQKRVMEKLALDYQELPTFN